LEAAQPRAALRFSIREDVTSLADRRLRARHGNIYFLGASNLLDGLCPKEGLVLTPGTIGRRHVHRAPIPESDRPVVRWNNAGGDVWLDGTSRCLRPGDSQPGPSDNVPLTFTLTTWSTAALSSRVGNWLPTARLTRFHPAGSAPPLPQPLERAG